MNNGVAITLALVAVLGIAGLALWLLADHRRGIAWAVSVVRRRFPDVPQLSPSVLDSWMRDPTRAPPQLFDARSADEFALSHLPGAQRLDPESTASAAQASVEPGSSAVIYCSAGYRGATLARRLLRAGQRDVWNLEGGIFAWANAGFPVECAGRETKRVHPYSRLFARMLKPPGKPGRSKNGHRE